MRYHLLLSWINRTQSTWPWQGAGKEDVLIHVRWKLNCVTTMEDTFIIPIHIHKYILFESTVPFLGIGVVGIIFSLYLLLVLLQMSPFFPSPLSLSPFPLPSGHQRHYEGSQRLPLNENRKLLPFVLKMGKNISMITVYVEYLWTCT